jgi:16S rRNA (cytosine1402-N4)-methyltransferase
MNRNAKYHHTPVLLNEVVDLLDVSEGDLVVDGTLGGGGYSKELLGLVGKNGKVLSIDLDEAALENFRLLIAGSSLKDRSVLVHGNFVDIDKIVLKNNFLPINKVVVDIGLSSYQLDNSGRGITFQNDELLDMRFDVSSKSPDARFILNHYDLGQLVKIFKDYWLIMQAYRLPPTEWNASPVLTRTKTLEERCAVSALQFLLDSHVLREYSWYYESS